MPIKINGFTISWGAILSVIAGISWLAGLSYQGIANADDLEKLEKVPVEIALMRQEQEHIKRSIDAIARALGVEVVADTVIATEEDE